MHAADAAAQSVACREAHALHLGRQQHGGGFHQRNGRATDLQAEADHAVVRDDGDEFMAAANGDHHFVVDRAGVDGTHGSGELVAGTGFHGHFPHEQIVVRHAGGLLGEQGEKLLVFGLDLAKVFHQLLAALREARAAAALAAAAALQQGLAGELVHVVDAVPGALVADADGLGRVGDGAGAGDGFKQGHLAGTAEQFALHRHAELALQADGRAGGLRHCLAGSVMRLAAGCIVRHGGSSCGNIHGDGLQPAPEPWLVHRLAAQRHTREPHPQQLLQGLRAGQSGILPEFIFAGAGHGQGARHGAQMQPVRVGGGALQQARCQTVLPGRHLRVKQAVAGIGNALQRRQFGIENGQQGQQLRLRKTQRPGVERQIALLGRTHHVHHHALCRGRLHGRVQVRHREGAAVRSQQAGHCGHGAPQRTRTRAPAGSAAPRAPPPVPRATPARPADG